MKSPVGTLSDRPVLRQQDGGALPRQVPYWAFIDHAPSWGVQKSVRTSNNLYGLYGVQKSEIQTITRLKSFQFAVRVRTSTDCTGCTNFFREKCAFYGQGWTSGSMPTKK